MLNDFFFNNHCFFFRINRFFLNRKIIKIWMATLLLMLLVVQLVSHLKKSFLQYSFPSREKHLSVKVHLQSQHWTHLMCHGLSRTLSRNRSTMGFSQLAQYSIACLQVAVILQQNTQTTTTKTTPSRSPHKSKCIRSVASSAASREYVFAPGVNNHPRAATRHLCSENRCIPKTAYLFFFFFFF